MPVLRAGPTKQDKATSDSPALMFCPEKYMKLVVAIIESAPREDFVLGTGTCTYARDLVRKGFLEHDLDFSRRVVETKMTLPMASRPYRVDTRKLKDKIGNLLRESIYDVCARMLNTKYRLSAAKAS